MRKHARMRRKCEEYSMVGAIYRIYSLILTVACAYITPDAISSAELDSRSQSMAGTSRIADVHAQLELRVKSLEADLKRSESEKETLRAEVSSSSGGSFMNGFGGGGGERTKILNLENEVEGLRKENVRLMEESRKVGMLKKVDFFCSFLTILECVLPLIRASIHPPAHRQVVAAAVEASHSTQAPQLLGSNAPCPFLETSVSTA